MKVLTRLILTSEKKKERTDAKCLKVKMDSFEFVLFTVMWERILCAMNSTSKELQSPKLGLSVSSRFMNCSISEIELLRKLLGVSEDESFCTCRSWRAALEFTQKKNRKFKRFFDELSCDDSLSDPERWFKVNVFYKAVDTALMDLQMRFNGQNLVTNLFKFLYPTSLAEYELSKLVIAAKAVIVTYPDDFTANLETKLTSFANEFKKEIEDKTSVFEIVSLMLESRVSASFPRRIQATCSVCNNSSDCCHS